MTISWAFLKQFNCNNPPSMQLSRKSTVEDRYKKHRDNLKKNSISIHEYITNDVIKDNRYVFVQNTFPYNVEDGIKHDLLWINPKYEISIDFISMLITCRYPDKDIVFFKNATTFQSIKSISHYHIFTKH